MQVIHCTGVAAALGATATWLQTVFFQGLEVGVTALHELIDLTVLEIVLALQVTFRNVEVPGSSVQPPAPTGGASTVSSKVFVQTVVTLVVGSVCVPETSLHGAELVAA